MRGISRVGRAFTLIELLVVVAVIAILISILLPSLGNARRLSRTVVCGTNLRALSQAMTTYAAEWDGAIMGGGHTSSRLIYNESMTGFAPGISENNVPEVISVHDWMTPAARVMGMAFNNGPTKADRIERFMQFSAYKGFTCPENDIVATAYLGESGPNFPAHRMISYNPALCFQMTTDTLIANNQLTLNFAGFSLGAFRPNMKRVGLPAGKVFIADGGRWYKDGELAITTNGSILGNSGTSPGGMSSDYGPWSGFSRAYLSTQQGDGRTVSMRHGPRKAQAKIGTFRFNLAFFDGHVETMNGLDGADPSLWIPKGSQIPTGDVAFDADIRARYGTVPTIR